MTKAITSTAAMQLVEQGKLALDRADRRGPARARLAAGAGRLRRRGRADSCARRGGRSPCATCSPIPPASSTTSGTPISAATWRRRASPGSSPAKNAALALPLVFDPGDKWDYGINIDWVGKAVERASGQRLGDYFARAPVRAARHEGHRLQADARAIAPGSSAMHARGEDGSARADPFRDSAGAGVPDGRRRALRHGGRLSRLRAAVPEQGPRQWPPGAEARDRAADGAERDRRPQCAAA